MPAVGTRGGNKEKNNIVVTLSLRIDNAEYQYIRKQFIFRPKRTLNSKKYGVDLIRYTHAVNTALHSSTKVDGEYFMLCLA